MFFEAYKNAFKILKKKPLRLWGLSMIASLVITLAGIFTFPALSIVGVAFGLIVSTGMSKVYVDAIRGEEFNSDQLFAGFSRFWSILGAYAWRLLWQFIWLCGPQLVAFVCGGVIAVIGFAFRGVTVLAVIFYVLGGLVFAAISAVGLALYVNRVYAYSFVPYIIVTLPDVSATEALRLSVRMTRGKKLQMWLATFILSAGVSTATGILAALAMIPYVGFVFGIVLIVFCALLIVLLPLFEGLVSAWFFVSPKSAKADKPDFIARMAAKLDGIEKEEPKAEAAPAEEAPAEAPDSAQ